MSAPVPAAGTGRPHGRRFATAGALALALGAPVGGLASPVPAAQAADARPSTWSGGALAPTGGPGRRAAYPGNGALVSLVTAVPRARLHVILIDPRCGMGGAIPRARAAAAPGGQGAYAALTVRGRRTQRYRSRFGTTKLTATVDLSPASPGVLSGTLRVTGTARDARRPHRCDVSVPIVVRSHQALLAPLAPGTTDVAAPRTGLVGAMIRPRVPASIALTRRADGRMHAVWSYSLRCRSGRASQTVAGYETARAFAVRADGSFRSTERGALRGRDGGGRFVTRFAAVVRGRVDADGIARGTVSNTQTTKRPGGRGAAVRCRTGNRRFVAAP
jgi:hypothetical protein